MDPYESQRFLRADLWSEFRTRESDQCKGIPAPPVQKPAPAGAELIDLIAAKDLTVGTMPLIDVINKRRSRRSFEDDPLTLEELSFLLWVTQGVQRVVRDGVATLRAVPSGGARHPFETYLWVNTIEGLDPGLYRYLPVDHKLCVIRRDGAMASKVVDACAGQKFAGEAAVTFFWTAIPYRTEWRYSIVSPKLIAQDSGHLCQNLYLAAESIDAGTCGIGAYDQAVADELIGVDGHDEFVVYIAPVGRV